MYLGPPYHSPYQYQHNPQRYPGPQVSNSTSSQYPQGTPPQVKQLSTQYSHGSNGLSSLPPYAEYQ